MTESVTIQFDYGDQYTDGEGAHLLIDGDCAMFTEDGEHWREVDITRTDLLYLPREPSRWQPVGLGFGGRDDDDD